MVLTTNITATYEEDRQIFSKKGKKVSYGILLIFYFLISVMQGNVEVNLDSDITSVDSYNGLINSYMRANLWKNS